MPDEAIQVPGAWVLECVGLQSFEGRLGEGDVNSLRRVSVDSASRPARLTQPPMHNGPQCLLPIAFLVPDTWAAHDEYASAFDNHLVQGLQGAGLIHPVERCSHRYQAEAPKLRRGCA